MGLQTLAVPGAMRGRTHGKNVESDVSNPDSLGAGDTWMMLPRGLVAHSPLASVLRHESE
jgi:hypothetical protein